MLRFGEKWSRKLLLPQTRGNQNWQGTRHRQENFLWKEFLHFKLRQFCEITSYCANETKCVEWWRIDTTIIWSHTLGKQLNIDVHNLCVGDDITSLRERSLFTAGGGRCKSENRMHSKRAPLGTRKLRFRPPRIPCTEILPPPRASIHWYVLSGNGRVLSPYLGSTFMLECNEKNDM